MDQALGSSAHVSVTLELPLIAITGCFLGYHKRFQTPGAKGGDLDYSFLSGHLATQITISPVQMHILLLAG